MSDFGLLFFAKAKEFQPNLTVEKSAFGYLNEYLILSWSMYLI